MPYLSPGMLHSLLCEFAEAGSQVAWLQAVIAASTHAAAGQAIQVPGIADGLRASPCCQAMLQVRYHPCRWRVVIARVCDRVQLSVHC